MECRWLARGGRRRRGEDVVYAGQGLRAKARLRAHRTERARGDFDGSLRDPLGLREALRVVEQDGEVVQWHDQTGILRATLFGERDIAAIQAFGLFELAAHMEHTGERGAPGS